MDLAPNLPPTPSPPDDSEDNATTVEALVFVVVLAMFLLHVLGPLRRRLSHGLLHHTVVEVYTHSYPLVSFTIGLMKSSNSYYNDFVVWAVFLLLLLSGTDSLTACRLSDIENWKSIYVKYLPQGFILVYILVIFGQDIHRYLWYPLSAILFVTVLKSYVMIASMRMVSKTYLGKNAKVIAEYMQHKDNQLVAFNPVTMEGYRYLVAGEKYCVKRGAWKDGLKVTTVEQIWQCTGNLLVIERKDLCLSMALSKMLNRRFAGFKLSEAELEKTHDFVFKGLLVVGDKPYQRAFRVIEEELVFVHDMYYTRYSYLYQKGRFLALSLPIIMFSLCLWLALTSLLVNKHQDRNTNEPDPQGVMNSTIFITVVLAFLEAYQLYLYIASGWFKVALIRSYVSTPFLQRSCCSEKIIDLILKLKAFQPWKGTLDQYCLLHQELGRKSRIKSCLYYATLRLVDKAKKGRKKSVKLSENVKKAIVDSLLASNGHLTNGVTSLQNNGVHGHLSWACDATAAIDGAVTRTILVWHIATTLCEHQRDKQQPKEEEDVKTAEAVKTASTLSKYCMHLVAFVPDLLPDHSSISESILDQSIDEAGKLLKGAKDLKSRCEKLMEISTHDCVGDETRLVEQGVQLARRLIEDIQEPALRWKVLSDFWAEMMLYVSPSDNARAHLELLPRGGEFITHLWALLTHAGVLNRGGPARSNNVV
ncbi:hypothetical protein BAE44_0013647 [Dichanthelium oligosanthes]|uniref:DUF4220 domain-containing protein n=1 Tax=Dichanthelium oligosanthes TaxID=888268 RepID=A0A1E5VJP6_9POAL|nr:hypothetical protein BAE44_0013647 [Dichanthelium oligosanthes]